MQKEMEEEIEGVEDKVQETKHKQTELNNIVLAMSKVILGLIAGGIPQFLRTGVPNVALNLMCEYHRRHLPVDEQ